MPWKDILSFFGKSFTSTHPNAGTADISGSGFAA